MPLFILMKKGERKTGNQFEFIFEIMCFLFTSGRNTINCIFKNILFGTHDIFTPGTGGEPKHLGGSQQSISNRNRCMNSYFNDIENRKNYDHSKWI